MLRVANIASYCFCCIFWMGAQAATVTVDCDAGGRIMDALAKARSGDTILTSGMCNEHVNIAPEHVRVVQLWRAVLSRDPRPAEAEAAARRRASTSPARCPARCCRIASGRARRR